ncbi:hypothetical protein MTO96_010131 [Rhipicephalus appendiculatus]
MASEERDFLGLVAQAAEAATIRTREPVCRPVPDIHQLQLRAARRRVERHFLKSSCPEKRRLFNRVNAVCRRHANGRTRQSWQGICHSLNEAKGGSRAWRLLRCLILGPAVQQPVLAVAIYLGISEEALAERLADRFATIPVTPPDAVIHPRLPKPPLGHHPAWTAGQIRALGWGDKSSMTLYGQHKRTIGAVFIYDNSLGSSLLFEARAGALRTLERQRTIGSEQRDVLCRVCECADETMEHIVVQCKEIEPQCRRDTPLHFALGFEGDDGEMNRGAVERTKRRLERWRILSLQRVAK